MDRISVLKGFIQINQSDLFSRHALALEYIKIGDDVAAREVFVELLKYEADYIGSYYHLGKLFERTSEYESAKRIYNEGIAVATKLKDYHSKRELQSALNLLEDELN